jgi:hypothetical protein
MNTNATTAYPLFGRDFLRPETTIAAAQNGLACWARAWTQVAHGFMSAGMAQIELARTVCSIAPVDWTNTIPNHGLRAAGREGVHAAHTRFDTVLHGYGRITGELAANLFSAAESLVEGLPDRSHDDAAATETAPAPEPVLKQKASLAA